MYKIIETSQPFILSAPLPCISPFSCPRDLYLTSRLAPPTQAPLTHCGRRCSSCLQHPQAPPHPLFSEWGDSHGCRVKHMAKAEHNQHVTFSDRRGQFRNRYRAPSTPVRGSGILLGILGQMRCLSLGCPSHLNLGAIFVSLGHELF